MNSRANSTLNMLACFAKGVKRYFFAVILATAVSILFNFLLPQVVGFTVDSVIGTKEMNLPAFLKPLLENLGGRGFLRQYFIFCALGVAVCAVLSGFANFLARISIAKATEGFARNLREALYTHVQNLPFSWHTKNQTGDIIQRCTFDVETARNFISRQLIEVLRTAILITFALVIMFSMHAGMALLVFAFIPLILLHTLFFYGRISRQFQKADEAEGDLMIQVQENLTGVRVVRAFGQEKMRWTGLKKK